jgi:hypothetical protein
LINANESALSKTPEAQQSASPVWYALAEEMKAAGAYQASAGLCSGDNPTTVRARHRKKLITDGCLGYLTHPSDILGFYAKFFRSWLCLLTGPTLNDVFHNNKLFIGGLYKIEIVLSQSI